MRRAVRTRVVAAQLAAVLLVARPMWLSHDFVRPTVAPVHDRRAVAVAVPARDEAATIIPCLVALDAAATRVAGPVTVVVVANNCRDDTALAARRYRPHTIAVAVDEVALDPTRAHAGGARRSAMDRAAELAGAAGVVMTTDADSRVDGGWIAANVAEIARGADAVAGVVTFDDADRAELPDLGCRSLEWRLAALHARIEHLVDPQPHDPWPRHIWAWGASLALTVAAYRAIGGLPPVPLAEDRALAAAVERADLRLRRSPLPLVFTSSRLGGRAPGGFADLLAGYARDATLPCDAALEPTRDLLRRLQHRARLRAATPVGFGARWAEVEARSPSLARRRVTPATLAAEVAAAGDLIATLERARCRADIRVGVPAG